MQFVIDGVNFGPKQTLKCLCQGIVCSSQSGPTRQVFEMHQDWNDFGRRKEEGILFRKTQSLGFSHYFMLQ